LEGAAALVTIALRWDALPHEPLRDLARADQKKALQKVIAFYRTDPDLMSNRATDPKPLVL
jgi:hypothetical protein